MSQGTLCFLLDAHIHYGLIAAMRRAGLTVEHVVDVGLRTADDPTIVGWAIVHGRIVITRNYRDYAPIAQRLAKEQTSFPGFIALPYTIPLGDVGSQLRAILQWVDGCPAGKNPAANTLLWL
ncbi:MAG TPA: DUF5615 family PIN-like protein [Gemmatimonadaceae bacterium]|nr:DUF5615 family PIN-like protein [Gemmatimonadaceae bacterium]